MAANSFILDPTAYLRNYVFAAGSRLLPRLQKVTLCRLAELPIPPPDKNKGYTPAGVDFAVSWYRQSIIQRFDLLIADLVAKNSEIDVDFLCGVFLFAARAHADRRRKSGLPEIDHPLGVAELAVKVGICDRASIAAILLHDVVEDTGYQLIDLRRMFGPEIANLVDGLTKAPKLYRQKRLKDREGLSKTVSFAQQDPRVIRIKLCDRLQNMQTLAFQPPEKQIEIAQETIDIYAPLANQMGERYLYRELQDLCLFYLRRDDYLRIEKELEAMHSLLKSEIETIRQQLFAVLGRPSGARTLSVIVSPQQIIYTPRRPFEVFEQFEQGKRSELKGLFSDVLSFLILVDRVEETDSVIGKIHRDIKGWEPIENTDVSTIGHPTFNGYEARHTRVCTDTGLVVRLQTTTFDRHIRNEGMIQPSEETARNTLGRWLEFLKNSAASYNEIRQAIRRANKQITVYAALYAERAPRVIWLPFGATALDMAYAINREVGLHAVSAVINGNPTSLDRVLGSNDRVVIITASERKPTLDDLKIAHTIGAAEEIRVFLGQAGILKIVGRRELDKGFHPLYLACDDLLRPKIHDLTRAWFKNINTRLLAKEGEEPLNCEQVETGMDKLFDYIGSGIISAEEALALFNEMLQHNMEKMACERLAAGQEEDRSLYLFHVETFVPDVPGSLNMITAATEQLGLNIVAMAYGRAALSIDIEINCPLHELQLRRVFSVLERPENEPLAGHFPDYGRIKPQIAGGATLLIKTLNKPEKK